VDGLAGGGFVGGAEEDSAGGVDESISASENAERRERLKAIGCGLERGTAVGCDLSGGTLQAIGEAFEPMAGGGDSERDVPAANAIRESAEPLGEGAGAAADCGLKAEVEFVNALEAVSDGVTEALEDGFSGEA